MVSSVEVFDPRAGSWMTGESLTCSRGCFGAVVIADSLYVIRGLNENEEVLDTVCKCIHMAYPLNLFSWISDFFVDLV